MENFSDFPVLKGEGGEDPKIFIERIRRRLVTKNIDPQIWVDVAKEVMPLGTAAGNWMEGRNILSESWDQFCASLMARFLPYSKRDQMTNSFLYMERNGEPMDVLLARFENIDSQMEPTPDLGLSLSVLKRVINDPEANLRLLELERRGGVQRISDAVAVLLDFHKAKSASKGMFVKPRPQSYYPNPGGGINAMRDTSRSRRERERGRSPTVKDRTSTSRERTPMGEVVLRM